MVQALGDAFTAEIRDAWSVAYHELASLMTKREDQLLQESGDWKDWEDFRISQKIQESSEITSFYLTPLDSKPLPTYLPGQYVSVRMSVPRLQYLQARQYTLSDAPYQLYYRISAKKEPALHMGDSKSKAHPGYISNVLHEEMKVGDLIQVSHLVGDFYIDTRKLSNFDNPIVLISAGVGLTPQLSILNILTSKNTKRKISWIHSVRNSQVEAFRHHIQETEKTYDNVRCHVFNKELGEDDRQGVDYHFRGRMSLDKLDADQDLCINDSSTESLICGPENLMANIARVLRGFGVNGGRIKMELFGTGGTS